MPVEGQGRLSVGADEARPVVAQQNQLITEAGSETILGGWVAGEGAGTLIAEIAVAVRQGLTAYELMEVIHAHPTLPEMIVEAAADSLGQAIHKAPAKRRSI